MTISPYSFQQLLNALIHAEEAFNDSTNKKLNEFVLEVVNVCREQSDGLVLIRDDNQPWIGDEEEIIECLKNYTENDDRDLMTYLCDTITKYAEINKNELSYVEESAIHTIYHSGGEWCSTNDKIENLLLNDR